MIQKAIRFILVNIICINAAYANSIIAHSCNILGTLNDPFEFNGDYGPEINPIREKLFALLISREAQIKNLTDEQIQHLIDKESAPIQEIQAYRDTLLADAVQSDRFRGPLLSELFSSDIELTLRNKQILLEKAGFTFRHLEQILCFMSCNADTKAFYFLKNAPPEFLGFDKSIQDTASGEGHPFTLPIVGSTQALIGKNCQELQQVLLEKLFTEKTLSLAKPEQWLRDCLENNQESTLHLLCSAPGQLFFYWLYQSLHLSLISSPENIVDEVNKVKALFASTLGNAQLRALALKEKLLNAHSSVIFVQECDTIFPRALLQNGIEKNLFLPIDRQNPVGSIVFLRSDVWQSDYQSLPLETYAGYKKGRISLVLATHKQTGEKFLLASAHGNSTNPADGRLQITLIKQQYDKLLLLPENSDLQLLIGIDANTKSDEDVSALRAHLDTLGLVATNTGPTTIKQRMVTAQHTKACRYAIDEEDYIITLKTEHGGKYLLTCPTVGFSEDKADSSVPLPNINNPSDHYPVGATLVQNNTIM